MATYAIGDIQGCFKPLMQLLKLIEFNEGKDTLWFVGDLVNRGPQSLEVLRFIKNLNAKHITVLGNHDLHLLAVAKGARIASPKDTIDDILMAPDRKDLIEWLIHRPLLHYDPYFNKVMVHAGLAPPWSLTQAQSLAKEVETVLRSEDNLIYLAAMYGNEPNKWNDHLQGIERWRCITNYLVRMRYCYADGGLELGFKGRIADKPKELIPWFELPDRANQTLDIVFGHWAALEGEVSRGHLFAIDTGCVWGRSLTALRLEDNKRFYVGCGIA